MAVGQGDTPMTAIRADYFVCSRFTACQHDYDHCHGKLLRSISSLPAPYHRFQRFPFIAFLPPSSIASFLELLRPVTHSSIASLPLTPHSVTPSSNASLLRPPHSHHFVLHRISSSSNPSFPPPSHHFLLHPVTSSSFASLPSFVLSRRFLHHSTHKHTTSPRMPWSQWGLDLLKTADFTAQRTSHV